MILTNTVTRYIPVGTPNFVNVTVLWYKDGKYVEGESILINTALISKLEPVTNIPNAYYVSQVDGSNLNSGQFRLVIKFEASR